jgi:hypothetical protein
LTGFELRDPAPEGLRKMLELVGLDSETAAAGTLQFP